MTDFYNPAAIIRLLIVSVKGNSDVNPQLGGNIECIEAIDFLERKENEIIISITPYQAFHLFSLFFKFKTPQIWF